MSERRSFLGKGLSFPLEIQRQQGHFQTVEGEERIRQAIGIILGTRQGERVMRPDFGCGIYDCLFEIPDYEVCCRMKKAVVDAIVRWEPRIRGLEAEVTPDEKEPGLVWIEIRYQVRATNNPYNLVYPFYMEEGFREVL